MGKVFSWPDLETDCVPTIENFRYIMDVIRKRLAEMPEIIGAAFYGSALNGGFNVRSDIDVIVIYNHDYRSEVIKELQDINSLAEGLYVPIEINLTSDSLAKTPGHDISRSLWEHLGYSQNHQGVIKADPQDLFCMDGRGVIAETLQYIAHKRAGLEKRWTRVNTEGPEKYRFLEKVLAAPMHVARKVLRCEDISLLRQDDSKAAVLKYYSENFKQYNGCTELFQKLCNADAAYTRALQEQLSSQERSKHIDIYPDQSSYAEALQQIEKAIPEVLDFLKMNYNLVKSL